MTPSGAPRFSIQFGAYRLYSTKIANRLFENRVAKNQRHRSILLLWACAATLHAQTAKPPMLRIDTGMHTTKITRIGMDAAERFLVTGSYDKTVRVWELATGRLLRTIRPPAGTGNEGQIYTVA
jgi:WD40 repeat protein